LTTTCIIEEVKGADAMDKKKTIKEITEIYCDLCHAMISDGYDDGTGNINFWGLILSLRDGPTEFTVKTNPLIFNGVELQISPRFGKDRVHAVLCKKCAFPIEEDIKHRMMEQKKKMSDRILRKEAEK